MCVLHLLQSFGSCITWSKILKQNKLHPSLRNHQTFKGSLALPKRMNFRKSSKRPLTPPLIFGKSCCRFFKQLYSLKNHTCGIFLKSPGYESIKNNDPCCQIQSLNFKFWGWLGPRLLVHWGKVRGSHRSGTGSHMETHRTEHVYISPVCCSRHSFMRCRGTGIGSTES